MRYFLTFAFFVFFIIKKVVNPMKPFAIFLPISYKAKPFLMSFLKNLFANSKNSTNFAAQGILPSIISI